MDFNDSKAILISMFKIKKDAPFYFENNPVYLFKSEYSFIPTREGNGSILEAFNSFFLSFPGFQEYCAPINLKSQIVDYNNAEIHRGKLNYLPTAYATARVSYFSLVTTGYLSSGCLGALSEADMFSIQFGWSYNSKASNFFAFPESDLRKIEKTYRNVSMKSISNKPYDNNKTTVYKKTDNLTIIDEGHSSKIIAEESDLLFQANDIWTIECEKNYTFNNSLIGFLYIPIDNLNILKIQNMSLKINNQTFDNLNFKINKVGEEFDSIGNRNLDKYKLEMLDRIEFNPLKGKFESNPHGQPPGLIIHNAIASVKGSLSLEFVTNNYENKLSTIKIETPLNITRNESQIKYETQENDGEVVFVDESNKLFIRKEQLAKFAYKEISYDEYREIVYGSK